MAIISPKSVASPCCKVIHHMVIIIIFFNFMIKINAEQDITWVKKYEGLLKLMIFIIEPIT